MCPDPVQFVPVTVPLSICDVKFLIEQLAVSQRSVFAARGTTHTAPPSVFQNKVRVCETSPELLYTGVNSKATLSFGFSELK